MSEVEVGCKFKRGDKVLIPLMDQRTGEIKKVFGVVNGSRLQFGLEKVTVRHPSRNVSVLMDSELVEHYVEPKTKVEKPKRVRKAKVVVTKEDEDIRGYAGRGG